MIKIYIFGAGKCGQYIYEKILRSGSSKIEIIGWIDNDHDKKMELPCYTIKEFLRIDRNSYDAVLVAVESRWSMTEMVCSLLAVNITDIYITEKNLYSGKYEVLTEEGKFSVHIKLYNDEKPLLKEVHFPLAMHCNLNCRRCGALSNINEEEFADLRMFENSLKTLKHAFSHIRVVVLVGGEPLLNPQLPSFVEKTHLLLPESKIYICTNGILVKKLEKDTLEIMKKSNVLLQITQYPATEKIVQDTINFLKKAQINYTVTKTEEFGGQTLCREGNGDQIGKPFENGRCVISRLCYEVYNERLYTCSKVVDMYKHKDYLGLEIKENEVKEVSVDLTGKIENGWDILKKFGSPHKLCRYCKKPIFYKWTNIGSPQPDDYIV